MPVRIKNHDSQITSIQIMNCIEGNKQMIGQITDLLNSIDNQTYTKPLDIFNGSSIGQHFRHILDFYLCLIKGIESGIIDYAHRDRNPVMESDTEHAKAIFTHIIDSIEKLSEDKPIQVWGDFSNYSFEESPLLGSSIGRELMFAHDHAVHHLAIIKIGIEAAAPELNIDKNLGVAPSTVKHRSGAHAADHNGR